MLEQAAQKIRRHVLLGGQRLQLSIQIHEPKVPGAALHRVAAVTAHPVNRTMNVALADDAPALSCAPRCAALDPPHRMRTARPAL